MPEKVPGTVAKRIADTLENYYNLLQTPPGKVEVHYRLDPRGCFDDGNAKVVAGKLEGLGWAGKKDINVTLIFSAPGEVQPHTPSPTGELSRHQLAEFIWLIFLRPDLMALLQDKGKITKAKETLKDYLSPSQTEEAAPSQEEEKDKKGLKDD